MLRSLSKAIKACQGFKEGNWRWLKWKVRMWGQCWNSLNGRPVSGQSWFLSWRPLDWFIWTLEKTESTRGHHNATQRAHYASERDHLNARLLKPEAVCEFLAVLRFLRNLRKSGVLDSARALIVPSSLSLSPAFYSNYNHLIWMMTVIIIMKRMLMMIRSCACFKTRTQGASHSQGGADAAPFCFFWHRSRTSDQLLQMAPLCNNHRHHHSGHDHKAVLAQ